MRHVGWAQMGDLYASAIGTTVLQLKEVPPRPAPYDGKLGLFELVPGVSQRRLRAAFKGYGKVEGVETGGWPPAIVHFRTHEAALKAMRSTTKLRHVAGGIDLLYNERSYDGRRGEVGREDDDGRGWCDGHAAPNLLHALALLLCCTALRQHRWRVHECTRQVYFRVRG